MWAVNLPEDDMADMDRLADQIEYVSDSNGQFAQSHLEDSMDEPIQDDIPARDGTSVG